MKISAKNAKEREEKTRCFLPVMWRHIFLQLVAVSAIGFQSEPLITLMAQMTLIRLRNYGTANHDGSPSS